MIFGLLVVSSIATTLPVYFPSTVARALSPLYMITSLPTLHVNDTFERSGAMYAQENSTV